MPPMRTRSLLLTLGIGAVALGAARVTPTAGRGDLVGMVPMPAASVTPRVDTTTADDTAGTLVEMRNVHFHVADHVALEIHALHGTMHPTRRGEPIFFDDKRSFIIGIRDAVVGLRPADLEHLLNDFVFAYPGAPLHDLHVSIEGPYLRQRGTMHKGVDIPFDITASLDVTPDGHIRIHPVRVRILGVNGLALMKGIGLHLDGLLDLSGAKGASVKGNDLYLAPDSILPPPAISGRVRAVHIANGEVVQVFGDSAAAYARLPARVAPPEPDARNYMYYRGGRLRFGKLVMLDAELQIIDADPRDPFDFDLDHYLVQLVAGFSHTLPDQGLEVAMPDFDDADRLLASNPPRVLAPARP